MKPPLTRNEKAANGPLPGDLSLYEPELRRCEVLSTPGYYPSLNGAEIADAERSGLFPAATFGGSFDGPNRVYAWRSEDEYQGTTFICNRRPGELYLTGGNLPKAKGPVDPGPYVAKADATTGKQIWRTYLENANVSGVWIGATNLNILPNGNIVTSWSNRIALLDGDTGRILKYNTTAHGHDTRCRRQLQASHHRARRHSHSQEPESAHRHHGTGQPGAYSPG